MLNEKFDVLVVNRGDKFLNFRKDCKKRFFWIHNPAKYLLKFRYLSKLFFNKFKIIFSSEYHKSTYPSWAPSVSNIVIPYGIDNKILKQKKKSSNLFGNFYFQSTKRFRLVTGELEINNLSKCKKC